MEAAETQIQTDAFVGVEVCAENPGKVPEVAIVRALGQSVEGEV